MNDKWLIGIDLDGTTVMTDNVAQKGEGTNKVNPINIEVFKKLDELGHKVVIVTGRSKYESMKVYDLIDLNNPMINNAGAYINHPRDDQFKEVKDLFKKDTMHKILNDEKIKDLIVGVSISTPNDGCLTYEFKESDFSKVLKEYRDVKEVEESLITSSEALSANITFDKDLREINNEIIPYLIDEYGDELHIVFWGHEIIGFGVEINIKNANKGISLLKLADMYGIDKNNTIAIGDGTNDVEFIRLAKIGVAMKNAFPGLKEISDQITEYSNDEGGVGIHLKKMFNIK